MIIAIRWQVRANDILKNVVITGTCKNNSEIAEYAAIKDAIEICKIARQYGGVIISHANFPNENSPLSIRFELIFKNKCGMYEFLRKVGKSA